MKRIGRSDASNAQSAQGVAQHKMNIAYSTSVIAPAQRFAYWSDVVCRHCIPATNRQLQDTPFDGELRIRHVGALDISKLTAPRHHWVRDATWLRRGPDDDLWLGCLSDGQAIVHQSGREVCLNVGDWVLYDAGTPFDFLLDSQAFYTVRLPRHRLLQRCAQAERLTAHSIQAQPLATALQILVEQAVAVDQEMHTQRAMHLGNTLLDLAAVMLEFQTDPTETPQERGLHAQILRYMHAHLDDPALCLDTLARAHHVSSRTITRAFARHHQTPMGMVWQLRLQASQKALISGRARSVTQTALDHGFSDPSHFSRAFRKAFGYAPHTLIQR